jgi:hypothetical protein
MAIPSTVVVIYPYPQNVVNASANRCELHVFGGKRVAVVKRYPLPQLEAIRPAVLALAPRGGE